MSFSEPEMFDMAGPATSHVQEPDSTTDDFKSACLIDFLEEDDRPLFVIDLLSPAESAPVYYNPKLQGNKGLKDRIVGLGSLYALRATKRHGPDWAFLQWQRSADAAGHAHSSRYAHIQWVATTAQKRWRVISGVMTAQNISADVTVGSDLQDQMKLLTTRDSFTAESRSKSPIVTPSSPLESRTSPPPAPRPMALSPNKELAITEEHKSLVPRIEEPQRFSRIPHAAFGRPLSPFDWTVPGSKLKMTPWIRWFQNLDWAGTKLGAINTWPEELRTLMNEVMADPRGASFYWGPERIMIYNEDYAAIVGSKHPFMMAKPFAEAWAELGDAFTPSFEHALRDGQATKMKDACFFLERADFLEECYFSVSMVYC